MMHRHHMMVMLASTLFVGTACSEKGPTAPVAVPVDASTVAGHPTAGDGDEGHTANRGSETPSHAVAMDTSAKDMNAAATDGPHKETAPANRRPETEPVIIADQAASGKSSGGGETGGVDASPANPMPGANAVASVRRSGPVSRVTLTEKWSVETETRDGSRLVVGPTHIFVTAYGLQKAHKVGLEAINKETGEVAWKKPLVSDVRSFGDVVVAWRPFQVLDAATGKQLWTRKGVMNYTDIASNGELLAFVSLERDPLRYRLTVAELRTGREIFHTEAPGLNASNVERRTRLSFDSRGLWVANRLVPEDPEERLAMWESVVADANDSDSGFPCDTYSDDRFFLTRNELREVSLYPRTPGALPLWRFTDSEFSSRCYVSHLLIDGDAIYSADERWPEETNEPGSSAMSNDSALIRHSNRDGSILWKVAGIDKSRQLVPTTFGLLLPGRANSAIGPSAVDHDGNAIEVVGHLPHVSKMDSGVIYAREGTRVMRIEVRTEQ